MERNKRDPFMKELSPHVTASPLSHFFSFTPFLLPLLSRLNRPHRFTRSLE